MMKGAKCHSVVYLVWTEVRVPLNIEAPSAAGAQRLAASMESSLECLPEKTSPIAGAQRLAASMESSLSLEIVLNSFIECSTPYGINGIITMHHPDFGGSLERCSTPCGINGIITSSGLFPVWLHRCAQRLAASMESSHSYGRVRSGHGTGAQRLAASMESSLRIC
jgi:hypothetical protein